MPAGRMRENMHARLLRARFSVVSLCLALIAGVALPTASLFTAAASAAPPPPPPLFSALKLSVTPARPSSAKNWPDAVGQQLKGGYKWLIQQDNTGDPNQPSGPIASNDGTITPMGGTNATLHSPSAPFVPADAGVGLSGTGLSGATISTVVDAQDVTLSGYTGPTVTGTYLFTILRADPCHPITPNTPQGDPNFPQNCHWPSIIAAQHPPVVTQGNQDDWGLSQPLSGVLAHDQGGHKAGTRCDLGAPDPKSNCQLPALPDGKYFVSVSADGYEIGGVGFTIPSTSDTVKVLLNPGPLTLGTMKILVFDDMASTAGAYEATTDSGMSGFSAFITDFTGAPVNQDYFGNPLCTQYKTDANGNVLLKDDGTPQQITKIGGSCESAPAPLGTLLNSPGTAGTTLNIKLLPGVTDSHLPVPGVGEWTPVNIQIGSEIMTVTGGCLQASAGGRAASSPVAGCRFPNPVPAAGTVRFIVQRHINGTTATNLLANIS